MEWYCSISEHLLRKVESYNNILQLLEDKVVALYKALLRYQMESVCSYYRPRSQVFLRGLAKRDDWESLLQTVINAEEHLCSSWDQYMKLENKSLMAQLVEHGKETESQLGNIQETLEEFVSLQRQMRLEDEDKKCLRDLRVVDPYVHMDEIEEKKDNLLGDAYKWILDTDEYGSFTDWSTNSPSSRSLLWIKGGAGTGKTMLTMGIIRELSRRPAAYTPRVSFFFFQGTEKSFNSGTAALRTLVWLLLYQQPQLLWHLRSRYEMAGSSLFNDDSAFIALAKIFKNMLKDPGFCPVYFVVDAFDECEVEQKKLRDLITTSIALSSKIKWLVSSRPGVEVKAPGTEKFLMELDDQKLKAPVNAFIKHKMKRLESREGYSPTILAAIEDEVGQRAQNTFLWVALVFKALDEEDADLEPLLGIHALDKIKEMPPSLSKLYSRMLHRIEKGMLQSDPQHCKNALAAAVLTYRPLSLSELVTVANFPAGINAARIVKKCGSFLTAKNEMVYLIHQSAKDFLLGEASNRVFPSGQADAHRSLYLQSVRAMNETLRRDIYELKAPGYLIYDLQPPNDDRLVPIRYSCIYWIDHLCACSSIGMDVEQEFREGCDLDVFFRKKYLYWLEALSLLRSMPVGILSIAKLVSLVKVRGHYSNTKSS